MPDLIQLQPYDEHNQRLESCVHPPGWINPTPSGRYNLIVVGAGTAGLVAAAGAAGLGAKVALIERELMGGDCLNVGCVPSKALIEAARMARAVRLAPELGVRVPSGVTSDFPAIMARLRRLRADLSPHDSADRFRKLGVDVFLGEGRFTGANSVQVGNQPLHFRKALIATGARATVPVVPGLDQVPYLTNESIFSLTELPRRLAVLGAGPIGCELAQAFANLGAQVWLIHNTHGVLPREDRDAAEIVGKSLQRDGVQLICCGPNLQIRRDDHAIRLWDDTPGQCVELEVDQLLVCTGRTPNVQHLGLEAAGVNFDAKSGVQVNDFLQTTNPAIYAAGDVCSPYKFTHAADFMSRIVVQNALFMGRAKVSALTIPWCTYTSPEIAHVGLSEAAASQQGLAIDTYVQNLADVDRALLSGETQGFVKVHTRKGTDRIVGATIVAPHAGDLIAEISLAMTHRLGLKKISSTIHPYPTLADAIRKLGDQYNRTRLKPWIKSVLQTWCRWSR